MKHLIENMLRNFQRIDKPQELSLSDTNTSEKDKRVLKRKITALLEEYAHLRDDDTELINAIWRSEMYEKYGDPDYHTLEYFFTIHQFLTKADSITRWRRRLQQLNPHLRGKLYEKRNQRQEDVKDELEY